ncbi:MAG: glycosyltransferase family protein [Magnetococcales bacterium]|nr:glycosyltransferase family protein [Magnetococcales bacterium]
MSAANDSLTERLGQALDLQKSGQLAEALALHEAICHDHPTHPHALFLHGLAREEAGDHDTALELVSKAVALFPEEADYHFHLGWLLKERKRLSAAVERFQTTLSLNPDHPHGRFALADCRFDLGQAEEAIPLLEEVVARRPDLGPAWNNLGLCHRALQHPDKSLSCFRRAILIEPDNPEHHVNLALALLATGDQARGWKEYEWRLKFPDGVALLSRVPASLPRWDGSSLGGGGLLIHAEQGYGDNIQFIRLLPAVRARGCRVFLECHRSLRGLLDGFPGADRLVPPELVHEVAAKCQAHIPLLSLPGVLGPEWEATASTCPYLQADRALVADWGLRFEVAGAKVGLVWSGKPLHKDDPLRQRSCSLSDLAPLADTAGISFFSMQKGDASQELKHPPKGLNPVDLGPLLTDFSQTAALMANLDLIITVDTAVAHLAGALGRPVWVILPQAPDWRWGTTGSRTPWYPTMRLFRREPQEKWNDVATRVSEALRLFQ